MKINKNFEIVQKHKIWFIISFAVITIGLIMFSVFSATGGINKGLNLGIDFTGGTQLDVEIGSSMNDDNKGEIKKAIIDTLNEFKVNDRNDIRLTGDNEGYTIIYRNVLTDEKVESLKVKLIEKINNVEQNSLINVTFQAITAKAGSFLSFYILLFILAAWILIMAYIAFRFELSSALAALFGLVHDVLIVFALTVIFRMEINSAFFGALIALVCYSIYNTVVVFDKIRENARSESMKDSTAADIVNKSLSGTIKRVIYTTAILVVMLASLLISGVPLIIGYSFFVILGLLAGAYSSLFIVPSVWALYRAKKDKKGKSEYFKKKIIFKRTEKTESNTIENQKDE